MSQLAFFRTAEPISLAALAAEAAAVLPASADPSRLMRGVANLGRAAHDEVSAFADGIDLDELCATRAGACLVSPRNAHRVPSGTVALVTGQPFQAFRRVAALLQPRANGPAPALGQVGIDASVRFGSGTRLEADLVIEPHVLIGSGVEIGAGTFIGAGTVIGDGVRIGRGCAIGPCVTLTHALVGDHVRIATGVRIGVAALTTGFSSWPHLGRVIIQSDATIGANSVVERGAGDDTVLGEHCVVGPLSVVEGGITILDTLPRHQP